MPFKLFYSTMNIVKHIYKLTFNYIFYSTIPIILKIILYNNSRQKILFNNESILKIIYNGFSRLYFKVMLFK